MRGTDRIDARWYAAAQSDDHLATIQSYQIGQQRPTYPLHPRNASVPTAPPQAVPFASPANLARKTLPLLGLNPAT